MGRNNKNLEIDVSCKDPFLKENLADFLEGTAYLVMLAGVTFEIARTLIACYTTANSLADLTYNLTNSFQGGF